MPLLRLPTKLLYRERIGRADVLDAPTERMIAEGRLILAALSLAAVIINPDLLKPHRTVAFEVLIAYAVFAIALVALRVWRFPRPTAGYAVHTLDIAFQVALSAVTAARASPVLSFFTFFVLLAASLRWDWHSVMVTAVALVIALWGTIALQGTGGNGTDTSPQMAIVRGVYVVMTGAMLAYYSAVRERRREQLTRLTQWPGPDRSQIDRPNLATLLAHCAQALETPRVLVLWEEAEEPFVNVVIWQNDKYQHTREMSGAFGNFVRSKQYVGSAFWTDDANSRFVVMPNGPVFLKAPIIDEALIETFAIRSVASAAFVGASCRGRMFVLDRDSWSDFQLQLIEITASRMGNALDRQIMQAQAKQAVAERERARLTRDLHDGLLQSLTAVGLQIKLITESASDEIRTRLDVVRQLLLGEQRRIRDFVRRMPPHAEPEADVPMDRSLQEVLAEITKHWDCSAKLIVDPPEAMVSSTLCAHLSLMLAEAVANAVRHGHASIIRVSIMKTDQEVTVHVRDDGRGFDGATFIRDDKELAEAGVGPFSLRARVHELGGRLAVKSSPAGVDLEFSYP